MDSSMNSPPTPSADTDGGIHRRFATDATLNAPGTNQPPKASGQSSPTDMEKQSAQELEDSQYGGFSGLARRFRARDKEIPGTLNSIKNVFTYSPLMILLVFVPISWAAHFIGKKEIHAREEDPSKKVRFTGAVQFARKCFVSHLS
jgi:hypothetical protein